MIKWTLQTKKIKSLIPHPKNPRYITKDAIKHLHKSLDKFGLIDKPIINLDNTIIGGHQRINALKESGVKEVECWIPDQELDDKDVQELCIRLNKNTGEWDFDILANEWEVDDLLEYGFSLPELGESPIEMVETEEEIEEKKDKTISCPSCGHEFVK